MQVLPTLVERTLQVDMGVNSKNYFASASVHVNPSGFLHIVALFMFGNPQSLSNCDSL